MIDYYTIIRNEEHYNKLISYFEENEYDVNIRPWKNCKRECPDQDICFRYNEYKRFVHWSGIKFYEHHGYKRKDICVNVVPEDMFVL